MNPRRALPQETPSPSSAHRRAPRTHLWNYDRSECIADGVVHGLGLLFAALAITLLIVTGNDGSNGQILATAAYAVGLLAMLGFSAAYNLWPVCSCKWVLRRLDHSAIYIFIAATYTPFVVRVGDTGSGYLLVALWLVALLGAAVKIFLPGRYDRLSIAIYVLLGWSGVATYQSFFALSDTTLLLLLAGGLLYLVGIIFHVWEQLRFQNAIWHAFVLTAAIFHYGAVMSIRV